MQTYAIKWEEKILVTSQNKDFLVWYEFIQEENKIAEIKQKYQDLIFAKYSLTDQLNMWNEATYIISMAIFEKRDYTDEEIARLNEIKEAKLWIDEQRKLCHEEIDWRNRFNYNPINDENNSLPQDGQTSPAV